MESEKMDRILSELEKVTAEVTGLKQNVSGIWMHLENFTDKSILSLVEGQSSLERSMNKAVCYIDYGSVLQVPLNYLTERVTKLEKDFQDFKNKSA